MEEVYNEALLTLRKDEQSAADSSKSIRVDMAVNTVEITDANFAGTLFSSSGDC